ncbi:Secretory lipase [Allosphingosinicella indica]|uniref:Secretory lipase n=2 Tax=Allosphingosinicella indica TaxID=941907 RepID=A0A1X7G7N1_9SPHN|nr:Secretory lipase [Allosphingosinicella indica]
MAAGKGDVAMASINLRNRRRLVSVLLLAATIVLAALWSTRPAPADPFYEPPSSAIGPPGRLIRAEPFSRNVSSRAQGWRILYATTRADGTPAVASGLVVVPRAPSAGPRPTIAWAHGTTGIAQGCAPSRLVDPFQNVPAVGAVIGNGWAYVASDYVGLGTGGGHAYLVGEEAARGVLDAVRAARQIPEAHLGTQTIVWGHSQGGHSALWTGASAYAPDVPLAGVAAMAPASDLPALFTASADNVFGKIVSAYVVTRYAAAYPEVRPADYGADRMLVRAIANRCVGGREVIIPAIEALLVGPIFTRPPREGPLGARLAENVPTGGVAAPLLIAQGEADDLVLPAIQDGYVAARCRAGQPIDYRRYAGRDHLSLLAADSPFPRELVAWTRDRIAGKPAADRCA